MEKAILKTLIYADIFDYPLKVNEIHKWLIGKKAVVRQVEAGLGRLSKKLKIKSKKDYYFLSGRDEIVSSRLYKQGQSEKYLKKAKILVQVLKIIPWIKLVGISGGLALNNASKKDDIDLFIITAKNRLWISRLLILILLSLSGQRRKKEDQGRKVAGKLCINILIEEDKLEQIHKDVYIAHEVLQMKVLWQKDGTYSKYLSDNSWVFRFLPNWIDQSVVSSKYYVVREEPSGLHTTILDVFGILAKKFQLWYMKQPQGMERIEEGALYFHPKDYRQKVLSDYKSRLRN